MKKVGIVTFQESGNYGALLQAYALKTAIGELGYSAEVINYHSKEKEGQYASFSLHRSPLVNLNTLLSAGITKKVRGCNDAFRRDMLALKPEQLDREGMKGLNGSYDMFVCGSDQIWNPRSVKHDGTYFLDFVDDPARRVAYAPSVGISALDEKDLPFFRSGVEGIPHLSVREKSGAELIKQLTGKDALVVLDPTLLLRREKWEKLTGENKRKKGYILLFMVGYSPKAVALAKSLAKEKNLDVLTPIKTVRDYKDGFKSFLGGPLDFLNAIRHADYVITTSFHGLMFSTLFQKQFLIVEKSAAKNEGACRIHDFMDMTGLRDRIYADDPARIDDPIDYSAVELAVEGLRERSLQYLASSLEACPERKSAMNIKQNESLAKHTSFKLGGTAEQFFVPESVEELTELVQSRPELYRYIISGGSNLLINDQKTFPAVLSMEKCNPVIENRGDGTYYVGASVRIQKLINQINQEGFGGIEYLYSLPAMFGGIVYMNAGRGKAHHQSIGDHILSVDVLLDGERKSYQKDECGFSHRHSVFQELERCVILGATLKFDPMDPAEGARRVKERIDFCRENQDNSAPTFGSVFRSSDNRIMKLVQLTGMGKASGCHFSKKTKNWMLHGENGSYAEAEKLIARIKKLHKLLGRPCQLEVLTWK